MAKTKEVEVITMDEVGNLEDIVVAEPIETADNLDLGELNELMEEFNKEPELAGAVEGDHTPAEIAVRSVLQSLQYLYSMGDYPEVVYVNKDLEGAFMAEWEALPEEVIAAEIKVRIPIQGHVDCQEVRVVSHKEFEVMFLSQVFGAREQGGNGLIPALQSAINNQQVNLTITPEFLKTLYLLRLVDQVAPRVQRVTAAEINTSPGGIILPGRG